MIEQDTIKLLRECDAGVKMGISSIEDVLESVQNPEFRACLNNCKQEHDRIDTELQKLLQRYEDDGKEPAFMAKSMSWMKTHMMMALDGSDETVADLITDGCNMGVKSLNQYLNQYQAADEPSKELAKKLIRSEEQLAIDIRPYL
ncbi:MAG: hypothetical protein E7397_03410 [Ruminococcaceae bacterium]|nr:hypothetical protein [Oscillospiraceae bacterium]